MKRLQLACLLLFCGTLHAQTTGILSTARSAPWATTTPSSVLPDASWTQCGSTLAAGTYAGSTITTTLAGCGAHTFYLLGAGSFTLTGKIQFPTGGNLVLRGSGANSTLITLSGTGATCSNANVQAAICVESSDGTFAGGPPANTCAVTAGLTQGSTSLTVTNLAGTCLSGITANQTMLFIDWCDTGFSGSSCAGTSTDNNAAFVSDTQYNATGPVGCCGDATGNNARPFRSQLEIHTASAVNTGTGVITLNQPILAAAFGSNPQIWIVQPIQNVGIENLSITGTGSTASVAAQFSSASTWWLSGVALIGIQSFFVDATQSAFGFIKDSYLQGGGGVGADTYGIRFSIDSFNLVQNTIFHNVYAPLVHDGPCAGDVTAYNAAFTPGDGTGNINWTYQDHYYCYQSLYEANYGIVQSAPDGAHATTDFETNYRNFYIGWASDPSAANTFRTNSVYVAAKDRYHNYVANILGTPGYHTIYQNVATPASNAAVFALGTGGGYSIPADSTSQSTSLFYGNYDSVTAAVRWNSSEVPTADPNYPNPVPTNCISGGSCPASFYLSSSKPNWFGGAAWPPIGPDVTSGNVFQCNGTLNTSGRYNGLPEIVTNSGCAAGGTGWAGHVNANPAMAMYLNNMAGPPDGSGGPLTFNPALYYVSGSSMSGGVALGGGVIVQ